MKIDVIIPFYNESPRLEEIFEVVSKLIGINKIIFVDDGSTDGSIYKVRRLKNNHTKLILLRHKSNQGKSEAIRTALKSSEADFMLTVDADLQNLDLDEIQAGVNFVHKNQVTVIFERVNNPQINKALNIHRVLSGERIIPREDLINILSKAKVKGYLLEVAINKYMLDTNIKYKFYPSSALNPTRTSKWGILRSVMTNTDMFFQIVRNFGVYEIFKQIWKYK